MLYPADMPDAGRRPVSFSCPNRLQRAKSFWATGRAFPLPPAPAPGRRARPPADRRPGAAAEDRRGRLLGSWARCTAPGRSRRGGRWMGGPGWSLPHSAVLLLGRPVEEIPGDGRGRGAGGPRTAACSKGRACGGAPCGPPAAAEPPVPDPPGDRRPLHTQAPRQGRGPPRESGVQARHSAQAACRPVPGEASPQPALEPEHSASRSSSTDLGVRGLHFLVHLQRVMMEPHFHKHLQESTGGSAGAWRGLQTTRQGNEQAFHQGCRESRAPLHTAQSDPPSTGKRETTHSGSKTRNGAEPQRSVSHSAGLDAAFLRVTPAAQAAEGGTGLHGN